MTDIMSVVKPLDESLVLELANRHELLVTVEENGSFLVAPLGSAAGVRALRIRRRAGANEWLRGVLKHASRDPRMPNVQFTTEVDAGDVPPGRHWLGLRVTGGDGSVETGAEQPIEIR